MSSPTQVDEAQVHRMAVQITNICTSTSSLIAFLAISKVLTAIFCSICTDVATAKSLSADMKKTVDEEIDTYFAHIKEAILAKSKPAGHG